MGTDRTLYTDYTASRQWYDVTIGTNDDSGHVIWQWTEGKLYIGGRLTFCMDATTSFYEGVQYTPTEYHRIRSESGYGDTSCVISGVYL